MYNEFQCKCCFTCKYCTGRASDFYCLLRKIGFEEDIYKTKIAAPTGLVCSRWEKDIDTCVDCNDCEEKINWIENSKFY